jgi:retron-type reverse transcriptase
MKSVARKISDCRTLHLVKMWLKAPVEVKSDEGKTHLEGGKRSKRGTPQGGVLSPLLANIYMHRFIKAFRKYRLGEKHGAVLVTYADDLVVLCRKAISRSTRTPTYLARRSARQSPGLIQGVHQTGGGSDGYPHGECSRRSAR